MEKPKAKVDIKKCLSCGGCISVCPQDAISMEGMKAFVDRSRCIGCAICIKICPISAIQEEVDI